MKVAIASDNGREIAQHFGRTRGFLICECDGNQINNEVYLSNDFTGHAHHGDNHGHGHQEGGGHNHSHADILKALNECDVVFSGGMGFRMINDFENHGKKVVITDERDARKALQLFLEGKLVERADRSCNHGRHH